MKFCSFLKFKRLNISDERGTIILLIALLLMSFVALSAVAIDAGRAMLERNRLQTGLDAGALAGVKFLADPSKTDTEVRQLARAVAESSVNAVKSTELSAAGDIELGTWSGVGTFVSGVSPFNSIRLSARRSVQAFFGAVLGIDTLRPNASAIAAVDGAGEVNCLIPFGLNASVLAGANFGDIITITGPSPGNWGKIDIDGNMSSNPVFVAAMTNLLCTSGVSIGDQFDPGTGFAGVLDGFEGRIALNPIVILPVVDHFPNGNSSKVTVVGFVAAKLLTNDQVPNGNQGNPASNNGNGNSGSSSAPGNSGNSNKNKNSGGNGNSNGNSGNSGNSSSNGNSGNSQNSGSNWSNKIELLNMVIGNRGGGPFVPPYAPFVGLVE